MLDLETECRFRTTATVVSGVRLSADEPLAMDAEQGVTLGGFGSSGAPRTGDEVRLWLVGEKPRFGLKE
jgi:hypothetical protein